MISAKRSRLVEALPGFSPEIGRLVCMLTYVRQTTLAAVEDLTEAQLDHLQDPASNSIGALLAHIAAVEAYYYVVSVEQRGLNAEEEERWNLALKLGASGRDALRGRTLEHCVTELQDVRAKTLEAFAGLDDDWLNARGQLGREPINHHWMWFHVFEDEVNHRGQIRWLRGRLSASA